MAQDKILLEKHREYETNGETKGAGIQLSESEYNGRNYLTLRTIWLTPDGQWRWSTVRPDSQGRSWSAIKLSDDEAKELYQALAKKFGKGAVDTFNRKRDEKEPAKGKAAEDDDDIPF